MLMSSASESVCSRDGEGDTELDLDVNILPQWGCFWPGPPTPPAGKDARLQARAGERRAAAGAVGARPSQWRRGAAVSRAAALKRAGPEPSAEGCRARSLRLELRIGAGPAGTWRGGRLSLQPAAFALPATAPILLSRIGWAGQVSELEARRERQSVRAPAGGPGSARPEGPRGSLGPGCGHSISPPPPLAPMSSPGPSCVQRLHRNWVHVCFVMGLESPLLASGWGRARVWDQTTGLGIPTRSLRSSMKLQ